MVLSLNSIQIAWIRSGSSEHSEKWDFIVLISAWRFSLHFLVTGHIETLFVNVFLMILLTYSFMFSNVSFSERYVLTLFLTSTYLGLLMASFLYLSCIKFLLDFRSSRVWWCSSNCSMIFTSFLRRALEDLLAKNAKEARIVDKIIHDTAKLMSIHMLMHYLNQTEG